MSKYQVQLYQDQQLTQTLKLDRPVVVTRRDRLDPAPVTVHWLNDEQRLVIADAMVREIPRNWFRLSIDGPNEILVENLRAEYPVLLSGGDEIPPSHSRRFADEALITIGRNIAIRVQRLSETPSAFHWPPISAGEGAEFRSLASLPPTPGMMLKLDPTMSLAQFSQPAGEAAVALLRVALQVVHQATGSDAFFQSAVEAAAEIVDLDRAAVLLCSPDQTSSVMAEGQLPPGWSITAEYLDSGVLGKRVPSYQHQGAFTPGKPINHADS